MDSQKPTDRCQPVETTVDGQPVTMRVHGAPGHEWTDQDRAALGQLADAAARTLAAKHPHYGIVQELMAAYRSICRALPANDSRIGRRDQIAAKKKRLLDAIQAARHALEGS